MSRISKQDWDGLPEAVRRRYERKLTGDQINDLRTNLTTDFLIETDPDEIIDDIRWFEGVLTEELIIRAKSLLGPGIGDIWFNDAIPFDRNLWGSSNQMIDASKALIGLLSIPSNRPPGSVASQKRHANILISNLYGQYVRNKYFPVWFFRDRNRWAHIERYHVLKIDRDTLAWFVDRLEEIGFLESKIAYLAFSPNFRLE